MCSTATSNTVGPTDYQGKLSGPFTAHPKICRDHRRDARVRLLDDGAVPDVPPGVSRRRTRAGREHHRRRADDDARLQRHRTQRHLHGPAGRVRSRACHARRDADPLERRLRGAPRRDAEDRHRRRRRLVRHRPLLRLPPDERLRSRRQDHHRRRPPRPHLARRTDGLPGAGAASMDDRHVGRARSRTNSSTTCPQSSRAFPTHASGSSIATAT